MPSFGLFSFDVAVSGRDRDYSNLHFDCHVIYIDGWRCLSIFPLRLSSFNYWLTGLKNANLRNRCGQIIIKIIFFSFQQWCRSLIRFLKGFTLLRILYPWLGYRVINQWSLDLLLYIESQNELRSKFSLSKYYVFPSS